jgi:CheY-like chemotaxis protein
MDGYEACRRLRKQNGASLKIVAITGWGQEDDKRRASEAGFDAHLTKPADPTEVGRFLNTFAATLRQAGLAPSTASLDQP